MSDRVSKVISVENNKQAHFAAITNAKVNNIKNVLFYNDDATKFINELAKNHEKIDVIIMDPPRTGSTEQFIMSCVKLKPKKIIYVSCGPDTLARDLKLFYKNFLFFDKLLFLLQFVYLICCFYHILHK